MKTYDSSTRQFHAYNEEPCSINRCEQVKRRLRDSSEDPLEKASSRKGVSAAHSPSAIKSWGQRRFNERAHDGSITTSSKSPLDAGFEVLDMWFAANDH